MLKTIYTRRVLAVPFHIRCLTNDVPSKTVKSFEVKSVGGKNGNKEETSGSGSQPPPSSEYDIVINGGGVVGFTLLAAINKSPFLREKKILLLEQQPKKSPTSTKSSDKLTNDEKLEISSFERKLSNRVSSLTLASKAFYEKINIWPEVEHLTKAASAMHVWSQNYNEGITFTPRYPGLSDVVFPQTADRSQDAVCHFIENHLLLSALERSVPNPHVRYGANVTDIAADGNKVNLVVGDGTEVISTNLLVGCDGYNSLVRRKSTIKSFEQKLDEKGIVGTVQMLPESEFDSNDVAYQRFLPEDGTVIALLPLTNNFSSFVISAPTRRADSLMSMSNDEFVNEFNNLLSASSRQQNILGSLSQFVDGTFKNVFKATGFRPGPPPKANLPQVLTVVPDSRAAFPLGFATTVPSLVGSPKGSSNKKVVIIGKCHYQNN